MAHRALCVGVDRYPGTDRDLRGAVGDARAWGEALMEAGFEVNHLLDGEATLAAMRASIGALLGSAREGDHLVITFAGHGTCVTPDQDHNETSGYDQGLAPSDFHTAGPLLDDELHGLFGSRPIGCSLLLLADCCHAGSVNRQWWAGLTDSDQAPRLRALPIAASVAPRPVVAQRTEAAAPLLEDDVLMAACEDGQDKFAAEVFIDGRPRGLYTHHAIAALKALASEGVPLTYLNWHAEILRLMPPGRTAQTPQFRGGPGASLRQVFR